MGGSLRIFNHKSNMLYSISILKIKNSKLYIFWYLEPPVIIMSKGLDWETYDHTFDVKFVYDIHTNVLD